MRIPLPTLKSALVFTLFLFVSVITSNWATRHQQNLTAGGCDAFGYARQAQLFRERGLLDGLDTRFDNPDVVAMIAAAKTVTPDSARWGEAVAPHCHHYNADVDAVILQYPPGTGFVLSLLDEMISFQYLNIIGVFGVAALFSMSLALVGGGFTTSAALAALLYAIDWLVARGETLSSPSVPITLFIIPFCVAATLAAFHRPGGGALRDVLALVAGTLAGLLISIRLTNALFVGLLAPVAFMWLFSCRDIVYRRRFARIAIFGLGFILGGPLPIALANIVNAGGPLKTTYGAVDASAPVLSLDRVVTNFSYYFVDQYAASIVWIAIVVCVTAVGIRLLRAGSGGTPPVIAVCAALAPMVSGVFFLTHFPNAPYYMVPASIFGLCLVVFDGFGDTRNAARAALPIWGAAVAVALVILGGARLRAVTPYHVEAKLPAEAIADGSILWADNTSGTIYHYTGKYAAKVIFTDREMTNNIVDTVRTRGFKQYFVVDSDNMRSLVLHLAMRYEVAEIGEFNTFSNYPVFKIVAKKGSE